MITADRGSTSTIEHFYRPQRSWGKVIFSEACVNNSVHGRSAPLHAGTPPGPEAGTLPPEQTSQEQTPPQDQRQAPPPGADTPSPSWCSACWEIRATSGRYASYWNAILFLVMFILIAPVHNKFDIELC